MSQSSNSPADKPMSVHDHDGTASTSSAAHQWSAATTPSPTPTSPQLPPPPDIPPKCPHRAGWKTGSLRKRLRLSRHSLPFSPFKSRSIAQISPTTAHSRSLSVPRRSQSRGTFSPLLKAPNPPLQGEITKSVEEVEHKVQRILAKHTWALERVEGDEPDLVQEEAGTSAPVESQDIVISTRIRPGRLQFESDTAPRRLYESASYSKKSTLDESHESLREPSGTHIEPCTTGGSDCITTSHSPSRVQSCPRIRGGEDIKEFSRRVSEDKHPYHTTRSNANPELQTSRTDGPSDGSARITKMNSFSNFDTGNINSNLGRQAPPQAPAQPMNGLNGVTQWPNVGAQSDMNVLWEYIVKLSDMHEQIRAQTQQVASGMQQIDSIRATNGSGPSASSPHINGIPNGIPPATAESAEIARLQSDLLAAQSSIEDLTGHINTLQALNTDYENAISHTLDKMRPFAQSHAQALLAQKAHYLNLLEQERSQNLELRLEQSRWQEKAKEIKDMMVETLKCQSESEVGYVRKIARLKADNRSLRRICGVPLMEDSEDDNAAQAAAEQRSQVRDNSVRQSPEQERHEVAAPGAPEDEQRA